MRIVTVCVALLWLAMPLGAQEKPAPTPVPAAEKAPTVDTPRVPDQDQQAFSLLLYRAQVQQEILAVLQKEMDSTNAEVSRLLARLQKPDFDLVRDPQTGRLLYLKKPAPEKKEPPK